MTGLDTTQHKRKKYFSKHFEKSRQTTFTIKMQRKIKFFKLESYFAYINMELQKALSVSTNFMFSKAVKKQISEVGNASTYFKRRAPAFP